MARTAVPLLAVLLFASFACALSSNRQPFITLDEFSDTETAVVIIVPSGGAPPSFEQSDFELDAGILGGERDVLVRVIDAGSQNVFSITTLENVFSFSSPPNTESQLLIQYDGADTSLDLDRDGLNSADLTQAGLADSVHIRVLADLDTTLLMSFYGSGQDVRTVLLDVDSGVDHEFEVPFDQFDGNGSFSSIGAIELFIDATTSVDVIISEFFTSGNIVSAPSPSPLPNDLDRIYMMVPLECAPDWPRFIPEFETSTYSTTFSTTTSFSPDDDDDSSSSSDDDDDDNSSNSSDDDDDNSSNSSNDDDDDNSSTNNSSSSSSSDDDDDGSFLNVSDILTSGLGSVSLSLGSRSFDSSDYSSSFYKNFIFSSSSDANTVTLSLTAMAALAALIL